MYVCEYVNSCVYKCGNYVNVKYLIFEFPLKIESFTFFLDMHGLQ